MESLAPRLGKPEPLPPYIHASGPRRAVVGLLTGCVQGAFFPGVNSATARVLQAEGCDVVVPASQGCCGALSVHNGREEEAQGYARKLVDSFESTGVEHVVVNAAGCGSTMKEYAALLADDPAYAERAKAFAEQGPRRLGDPRRARHRSRPRHPLDMTIAYHDACHLAHAQGVRAQPRRLLEAIPGLSLKEISEPELCCGSAGIYNIVNPQPARELGDRKAANIVATGAAGARHRQPRLPDAGHLRDRALRPPDGDGAHHRGARRLDPGCSGEHVRPPLPAPIHHPARPPTTREHRCSSKIRNPSATRSP